MLHFQVQIFKETVNPNRLAVSVRHASKTSLLLLYLYYLFIIC